MIEDKIKKLLLDKFEEDEYNDCYIIEIRHTNIRLEVFLDCDGSLTFRKCQRLSRYLEGFIDEEGWLGEKYVLEVSSPGIGRPLIKRQYKKHIDRILKLKMVDGSEKEGRLRVVNEESIEIQYKQRIKIGKKKKTETVDEVIPFSDINQANVKITFNK